MKKSYKQRKDHKQIYLNQGSKCQYIVGTPGLGKSCFFATSKFLHDLKIKYLIKNPDIKNQAIFPDNIKIFYFMPQKNLSQVKKSVLEQYQKDFELNLQQKMKFQAMNDDQFFLNLKKEYLSKEIKVQYVVDQFNLLYKPILDPNDEKYLQEIGNF